MKQHTTFRFYLNIRGVDALLLTAILPDIPLSLQRGIYGSRDGEYLNDR